jgi:hypothetical protein
VSLEVAISIASGRNWINQWKPLIDSLGPILGERPGRSFHPRDDLIISLSLHHTVGDHIGHEMWWTAL